MSPLQLKVQSFPASSIRQFLGFRRQICLISTGLIVGMNDRFLFHTCSLVQLQSSETWPQSVSDAVLEAPDFFITSTSWSSSEAWICNLWVISFPFITSKELFRLQRSFWSQEWDLPVIKRGLWSVAAKVLSIGRWPTVLSVVEASSSLITYDTWSRQDCYQLGRDKP